MAAATAAPRLTGGIVASVFLHGGLIAAFVLSRPGKSPPMPQMIQITMVAAEAGPPAIGVTQRRFVPCPLRLLL